MLSSYNSILYFCSAYSSELFQAPHYIVTVGHFTSAPLTLLSCFPTIHLYLPSTPLTLLSCFLNTFLVSLYSPSSAPLTLLSCFGRTAHFFKVQLAKKTQLLLMHSYYMAYSCINCQILLHRIILTCSFSSANPTAILWVLNVRTPW